ncbi:hypothetical protein AVEN_144051-1 [Araneus ventricosus]|uniref:Uncharacterized protein n=1 Tax=Araneus ventricosus TaxID=182803 RepID=A0A4Y2DGX3_ARAVE|nr:hypothetical protein AVEN_144051-1 [Araneus ventricosus]
MALDRMSNDQYKLIIRAEKAHVGEHERRFNVPTVNEAIVMVEDEADGRDIIIKGVKVWNVLQRHIDLMTPFSIPLFFGIKGRLPLPFNPLNSMPGHFPGIELQQF